MYHNESLSMDIHFEDYFPFWNGLSVREQENLKAGCNLRQVHTGEMLHNGAEDCIGLLLVISGRLRVYILSDEGKEITLYRLLNRDICLLSASCMMHSLQFDVVVKAECDGSILQIPTPVYKKLMDESLAVSHYTNELLASRFSDVMWLMDQILYKKLDSRLAAFFIEQYQLTQEKTLNMTHEEIARHLGSAREVVSRMLKYFSTEHLVTLTRGGITIDNMEELEMLAADSLR